jgi:hypothetical protein
VPSTRELPAATDADTNVDNDADVGFDEVARRMGRLSVI